MAKTVENIVKAIEEFDADPDTAYEALVQGCRDLEGEVARIRDREVQLKRQLRSLEEDRAKLENEHVECWNKAQEYRQLADTKESVKMAIGSKTLLKWVPVKHYFTYPADYTKFQVLHRQASSNTSYVRIKNTYTGEVKVVSGDQVVFS